MRLDRVAGVALIAASAYFGRKALLSPRAPWPPYAEPQATCGEALPALHEGAAIRFRYPEGWRVVERVDREAGMAQTFLAPAEEAAREATFFIRELGVRSSAMTIPEPAARPPDRLRDAPAAPAPPRAEGEARPAAPAAERLRGTDQAFPIDDKRRATAYLTRAEGADRRAAHSWMAFLWDVDGRVAAVAGPKLPHTPWPGERWRNRRLNCVFWDVLRSLELK
ncbi:MAG: hypothetical protein HY554_15995 [Elusimicrobia bacterium]|nr:hypothetical protein [Elusimicrobiota bacterium]